MNELSIINAYERNYRGLNTFQQKDVFFPHNDDKNQNIWEDSILKRIEHFQLFL
jgi:hypothetical protein